MASVFYLVEYGTFFFTMCIFLKGLLFWLFDILDFPSFYLSTDAAVHCTAEETKSQRVKKTAEGMELFSAGTRNESHLSSGSHLSTFPMT